MQGGPVLWPAPGRGWPVTGRKALGDKWKRRRPEIRFYWNPMEWEWRTVEFEHCIIRQRGPVTITTYRAWASHHLYTRHGDGPGARGGGR